MPRGKFDGFGGNVRRINLWLALTIAAAPWLSGCADGIADLSSTAQSDTTDMSAHPNTTGAGAALLSAFYGLDDAIPFLASYRICREFGHQDGMPVIFSKEVDINTLEAGDFRVTLADGQTVTPGCVTPAPAEDIGEFRTILTIGDFGSINNQPRTVTITGNIISLDQQTNFAGAEVSVTALEDGPTLVLAESVAQDQWELNKESSGLPFGGGTGCPTGTKQIVRAVWAGGVTKPGGDDIDDTERAAYKVFVADSDGGETVVTPMAIGDLGDGDNNHKLCLDVETPATRIAFPENLMTDPREDLNPATSVVVTR